jgi:hypothetical protein
MQHLPRTLVDRFAQEFAVNRVGFAAREITDYFGRYSNLVKPFDHYGMNPTRKELFIEAVYSLSPKQQYYALNDLTFNVHPSRYPYPSEEIRQRLRDELHNFISTTPIGLGFSRIRETAFREDWVTCQSRIPTNPSAAITAARTLLETLLKTIIAERGHQAEDEADLGRLLRQTEEVLAFNRGEHQAEHQLFTGLTNVINGLCTIANAAGDRHGTVGGRSIDDPYLADLCVNAAGTVGLAFIELHLFTPR